MGFMGNMLFQDLDQTALAYPGFPTQQNDLPMPCLGLLPTFHQESNFGFSTDQGCESLYLSHIEMPPGSTLTQDLVHTDR